VLVELAGVTKRFGGLVVVDDLSLTVASGEALGVIGPNGAGKTTMLDLVAGDLRPERGVVRFAGRDITHQRADQRVRAGIARTAQVPRPYPAMTVFENVLVAGVFGATGRRGERAATPVVVDALDRTGLLDRANDLAGSLGLLGRKRLELAKALATSPQVLLLDEIAGGLTEAEVHELVATITELHAGGMTIVWIEHVVHALLAVVGRMAAISFGRLIGDGDPAAVMASAPVREVYLGVEPETAA